MAMSRSSTGSATEPASKESSLCKSIVGTCLILPSQ